MHQQRNLLFFFVLVSLLLFVYLPLRSRLVPDAPPPEADPEGKATEAKKKEVAKAVVLPTPPPVTPENKLLTLGDESPGSTFNLQVILDPRGGGVRAVTLNKF